MIFAPMFENGFDYDYNHLTSFNLWQHITIQRESKTTAQIFRSQCSFFMYRKSGRGGTLPTSRRTQLQRWTKTLKWWKTLQSVSDVLVCLDTKAWVAAPSGIYIYNSFRRLLGSGFGMFMHCKYNDTTRIHEDRVCFDDCQARLPSIPPVQVVVCVLSGVPGARHGATPSFKVEQR